ncbi:hypothetical protein CFOL_v3_26181 [Cephalotus follicularis]|uniref:BHLH domain-containing protein n=1 Tax=Cephalotus follicularis TaxID=3775 RepID=A0A1Q3CR64_CEPFO|nr:hypothetical protein CFOL_v3_26181 [Cephalotus follicularis]
MDDQSGWKNPLRLMSLNLSEDANDYSYGPVDDLKQHFVMGDERSGKQPNDMPLPHWIYCQKPSRNYVEYLTENSAFLDKASPADMLECLASPVGSTLPTAGISEFQLGLLNNDLGKSCGSKPADSSLDMNAWRVKPSYYVLSDDHDHEAPVWFLNPHNEGEPANQFSSSGYQTYALNRALWAQEQNEDNCNVSQLQPRVSAAVPEFVSKPHYNASRQRSLHVDRRRRTRIAERLKALQELLPHSVEGNQQSVFDDVIDQIKYLQLQMKELSRSRLGGEPTFNHFTFIEGYGHYVLHEQMTNEPLEEIMGKLLEINPLEATHLLESRGLYVIPIALAEVLGQAM